MRKVLAYPLGFSVPDSVTDETEYEKWLNRMLTIAKHTIVDDSLVFIGNANGETTVKLRKPMNPIRPNDWDWFEFHMNGSDSENAIFFREFRRRIYNILMNAEDLILSKAPVEVTTVMKSLKVKIINGAIVLMVCDA